MDEYVREVVGFSDLGRERWAVSRRETQTKFQEEVFCKLLCADNFTLPIGELHFTDKVPAVAPPQPSPPPLPQEDVSEDDGCAIIDSEDESDGDMIPPSDLYCPLEFQNPAPKPPSPPLEDKITVVRMDSLSPYQFVHIGEACYYQTVLAKLNRGEDTGAVRDRVYEVDHEDKWLKKEEGDEEGASPEQQRRPASQNSTTSSSLPSMVLSLSSLDVGGKSNTASPGHVPCFAAGEFDFNRRKQSVDRLRVTLVNSMPKNFSLMGYCTSRLRRFSAVFKISS